MNTPNHELVVLTKQLPIVEVSPQSVVTTFLKGRSANTKRAYTHDLDSFRLFLGVDTLETAAAFLLSLHAGKAHALALSYQSHLKEKNKSVATINRHLSCLSALVALAQRVGLVTFELRLKALPEQPYRDTRGPGHEGFVKMLTALQNRTDQKGTRDRALLRLLFDLALRRNEVLSLNREHLDMEKGTLSVLGKGKTQRLSMTLPLPTREALRAWLQHRGDQEGPLFHGFDPGRLAERLSGHGLYKIVQELGKKVGVNVRPHGLRHAAITYALDKTNGDVRRVQKFSRHADLKTLCKYDDARHDVAGEIAELVSH
jgi:integrase/recombinase XerC